MVLTDAGFALNDTAKAVEPGKISANLSQEQTLDLDAEHLFIATWNDDSSNPATQRAAFETNPLWIRLTGQQHPVEDLTWMTAVGLQGANIILDDIARTFDVPA